MTTIWSGTVTALKKNQEDGSTYCQLPDGQVLLHKDLIRHIREGDEVITAGDINDDSLHAVAVNNLTTQRTTHIDVSNYMLTLGLAGFMLVLGLIIIGRTSQGIGEASTTLFSLLSLAGLALGIWALLKSTHITKASVKIR